MLAAVLQSGAEQALRWSRSGAVAGRVQEAVRATRIGRSRGVRVHPQRAGGSGGGERLGEGSSGGGSGAEWGDGGRIDVGAWHGLPHGDGRFGGLLSCGVGLRGDLGMFAAEASPPAEETTQQGGGFARAGLALLVALQVRCCLLEIPFPLACKAVAGLFFLLVEAALLGTGEGTPGSPVGDAFGDAAHQGEVGVHPLARGVEGEGGGQVHGHRDHEGEHDGRAGQVQVMHHGVGDRRPVTPSMGSA